MPFANLVVAEKTIGDNGREQFQAIVYSISHSEMQNISLKLDKNAPAYCRAEYTRRNQLGLPMLGNCDRLRILTAGL